LLGGGEDYTGEGFHGERIGAGDLGEFAELDGFL